MNHVFLRSVCCVLLFSVLLFVCGACGAHVRNIVFQNAVHQSETISDVRHTGDPLNLTTAAASEAARLLIDRETCNIAYADDFSEKVWSALPQNTNTLAAAVSAVLVSENGRYYLNSQDNAVAFGTVKTKNTSDGVQITYTMALSKESAKKSEDDLTDGEAYLRLTLSLAVDDSRMTAEIDCSDLYVADGFILERLSVLPYFGAIVYENSSPMPDETVEEETSALSDAESDETGEDAPEEEVVVSAVVNETPEDYLVVPDGSGALIRTNSSVSAGLNLTFPAHTGDGVNSPYVPAAVFGIKNGMAAFVCAVTQGDAVASVRVLNLSDGAFTFNTVYPEFLITDTKSADGKMFYGTPFSGTLQLVYKFLSGNAADYISMAIAAGEELIRAGVLPQSQISDTVVPLNVGLICSADGTKKTTQTTYVQAEDMLSVLKAKGIDRANILLQGAFSGGLSGKTLSSLKNLQSLGGGQALDALCSFAQNQGFNLYAGVNILSTEKKNAAKGIAGEALFAEIRNPLYPEVGERVYTQYLQQSEKIADGVLRMLSAADKLSLAGICVNDAAKNIYEDVTSGEHRAVVSDTIGTQLAAIAAGRKLAMNGADLAAVKNASLITSLPFDAFYETEGNDAYEAIPLFPAMLHGAVIYSGFSVNTQAAPYLYLLKTAEYGGVPFYEWTCTQDSRLYYENSLTEAIDFVAQMNAELGDLLSEPINGHQKLRDGVYRTVYENGAVVFVNYNNYSVIINNISVAPYSFLRLN